jgi:multidrug efflux pump subunit AcrA (membrane-fusion protein)
MTVVEKRPLLVFGAVGEKDLLKVSKGHTGWATPTAKPADRVPVTVKEISRVPTAPGQYALTLSAEVGEKAYLLPGMNCTVKLVMYEKQSVITVPSTALHQNAAGEMFVRVKGADGSVTGKVVKTGPSHGGKTEITKGLKDGDEVVLP